MSRFATIGGAAVLGLAGAYWLTKELQPEKDAAEDTQVESSDESGYRDCS